MRKFAKNDGEASKDRLQVADATKPYKSTFLRQKQLKRKTKCH